MNPPLPPWGPPRADRSPLTKVTPSDQMTMVPPSPVNRESAMIKLPAPTVVAVEFGTGPLPCTSPPMRMSPPPAPPEASRVAPLMWTVWPETSMLPPRASEAGLEASSVPETSTAPLPPATWISAPLIRPWLWIAAPTRSVETSLTFGPWMEPVFVTPAFVAAVAVGAWPSRRR